MLLLARVISPMPKKTAHLAPSPELEEALHQLWTKHLEDLQPASVQPGIGGIRNKLKLQLMYDFPITCVA